MTVRQTAEWLGRNGYMLARQTFTIAKHELALLSTLLVIAGGGWAFVGLADEVSEGETLRFDRALILAFRNPADPSDPLGPQWFEEAMRDLTALGSVVVLTLVTLLVIGFFLIARRPRTALLIAASVGGATLLSFGLKAGFERARPDLVPHGAEVYTASFPSAHAMMSASVYLTLGALLARMQLAFRLRLYFLIGSVLVAVLIGVSRIYLGVHWPSDVLAGWAVGSAWAMLVWLTALLLQRFGKIASSSAGDRETPEKRSVSSDGVRER